MQLQSAGRVHAGDRALDSLGDGFGLVLAVGYQDGLAAIQDRAHPHADGVDRHVLDLFEEAGVVLDGRAGQRLQSCPRAQRAGRLVEANVAIGADAQDLDVNAAALLYALLVPLTERPVIPGGAGGDLDVVFGNVDVLVKVLVHEAGVALWMIGRQTHILVEVEGRDLGEVQAFFLVHARQFLVQAQRA